MKKLWILIGLISHALAMEVQPTQEKTITQSPLIEIDVVTDSSALEKKWADMDTTYTRVIGLGSNCCTKFMINRYFNPHTPSNSTKKGHADLFDWTRMHDYDLLTKALSSTLEDIFDHKDFTFIKNDSVWSALENKKYDMYWNHLFDGSFRNLSVLKGNEIDENDVTNPNSKLFTTIKKNRLSSRKFFTSGPVRHLVCHCRSLSC
jgi:hypothetical protein